jgi:hypothetical protein
MKRLRHNHVWLAGVLALVAVSVGAAGARSANRWTAFMQTGGTFPAWQGHANDSHHMALAQARSQPIHGIHWQMSVDLHPVLHFGVQLEHYGSTVITAANTAIVPVKQKGHGVFAIVALSPSNGQPLWTETSDYKIPPPHYSQTTFGPFLTRTNTLIYPGPGGTIYERQSPNSASGTRKLYAFYGNLNYRLNRDAYDDAVAVDTPVTADAVGTAFFGYRVFNPTPIGLRSGIARVTADGSSTWIDAGVAAGDTTMNRVQSNSAPAVSLDGTTVYAVVSNGSTGYLVGLDSLTLHPKYKAQLLDPQNNLPAGVVDYSSASPSVGPDGDVYIGVLSSSGGGGHNGRGWLLHFDSTLTTVKTPGSFGWDDTASVVPPKAVASYTGSSSYLLLTKYNNYYGVGTGDGKNRVAVLDPDATEKDPYSNVLVMNEVITVLGPTQQPGAPPGAVYEWCVNSVAVDPTTKSALVNSEDGNAYKWDFTKNQLTQKVQTGPPAAEAYTPTVIGPDGTGYTMNGSELFALGS